MTRGQLLQDMVKKFKAVNVDDPRLTAEILLEKVLDIGREELYLNPNAVVPSLKEKEFTAMARRVMGREPIQYIVQNCEFYGLPLAVGQGALIPRPETELIVDLAKRFLGPGERAIMDVGTGTGALALALLAQSIGDRATAVDISGDALKIAAANAKRHSFRPMNVDGDVVELMDVVRQAHFVRTSFDPVTRRQLDEELWLCRTDAFSVTFRPPLHPFDLIVSNPPYVTEAEYEELPTHIHDHEPREALVAGEDGLDVHRRLTRRLKNWLAPGGLFLGEIGAKQGPAVVELHQSWSDHVELFQDYNGHDRVVAAWKAS